MSSIIIRDSITLEHRFTDAAGVSRRAIIDLRAKSSCLFDPSLSGLEGEDFLNQLLVVGKGSVQEIQVQDGSNVLEDGCGMPAIQQFDEEGQLAKSFHIKNGKFADDPSESTKESVEPKRAPGHTPPTP